MSQERTETIVLRGVDFSETSRIVTFLSPDRGRMACIAKGARRPKSQLAGTLDTFNRLEIVYYWKDGRAVQQLGEATVLDGFRGLKSDLEKTTFGALALELAYKIAQENEPSEALYAALARGLKSLDGWTGDARSHCCWQLWQLLAAGGFEPALEACIECGRPVSDAPSFAYSGGVACPNCGGDVRLSAQTYASFCALADSDAGRMRAEAAPAVFGVLVRFASHQLETGFRSVRVIEEMFGVKTA